MDARSGNRLLFVVGVISMLFLGSLATFIWIVAYPDRTPPPASLICPNCRGSIIQIVYGLSALGERPPPQQTLPNGQTFGVLQSSDVKCFAGGCGVSSRSPYWICERCCRTWLMPQEVLDRYHGGAGGFAWFWDLLR